MISLKIETSRSSSPPYSMPLRRRFINTSIRPSSSLTVSVRNHCQRNSNPFLRRNSLKCSKIKSYPSPSRNWATPTSVPLPRMSSSKPPSTKFIGLAISHSISPLASYPKSIKNQSWFQWLMLCRLNQISTSLIQSCSSCSRISNSRRGRTSLKMGSNSLMFCESRTKMTKTF